VIPISRRFWTIRIADQGLVIQGGRVLEPAPHEVLMQLNGQYVHLGAGLACGQR
jgi:ABC-type multidrug transport system fused ATPase/permease subunit